MSAFVVSSKFTAKDHYSSVITKMSSRTKKFVSSAVSGFTRVGASVTSLETRISSMLGRLGLTKGLIAGLSLVTLFTLGSGAVVKYDENIQSLQAITGVTGKQFETFESQIASVSKEFKISGAVVAKSFEQIGSAQPELLKSAESLAKVSAASIILSRASRQDLQSSTDSVTSSLNQFNLKASSSNRVINVLAAGAKEGAAAIPLVTESLIKFGAVADSANVSIEGSVALIELLGQKSIFGAEAGTSLRNVINKLSSAKGLPRMALTQLAKYGVNLDIVSDKNLDFAVRLRELSKIQEDSVALTKVFGVENLLAGKIILGNVSKFEKLRTAVTGTNEATKQAAINSASFSESLGRLRGSFENVFISGTKSTGVLSSFGGVVDFVADNMGLIIGTAGLFVGGLLAISLATKTVIAVQTVWSFLMGVLAAANVGFAASATLNTASITGMSVAMGVAAVATKVWTAAQWLINAALTANPIGLIVVGIGALIAGIVLLVRNWDSVTEAVSNFGDTAFGKFTMLFTPIGFIVNLIKDIGAQWSVVTNAFKSGGILAGLKQIGSSILSLLLKPIESLLKLVGKIPGLSFVSDIADNITDFRTDLGGGVAPAESSGVRDPSITSEVVREQNFVERLESETTRTNDFNLNINNNTGLDADLDGDDLPQFNFAGTTGDF